jgi:hypothetical protein
MRYFRHGDQRPVLAPGSVVAHFRATWYHKLTNQTGPIIMALWEDKIIRTAQALGLFLFWFSSVTSDLRDLGR